MNYIIMDLEWNQALNPSKTVREPVLLHGEIIQIGAVKTDDKFNLIDKIKINVRPKYYKKMNPHVAQITGITDMQLTSGETFPQSFRRFKEWCGSEFRFITWGFDDLNMLADILRLPLQRRRRALKFRLTYRFMTRSTTLTSPTRCAESLI